jgi:putative ABC transport system substrate-binding protein
MRRREFIAGLGSAAACSIVARAQQPSIPIIGYLSGRSSNVETQILVTFRRGLKETGYIEGQNVAIEYRFADGQPERLSLLAADLALRQAAVIVYVGVPGNDVLLRMMGGGRIPIVFVIGSDPVERGLVASLSHPGGNLTGVSTLVSELAGKQLGLLHDCLPNAAKIAMLSNPHDSNARQVKEARAAATALGLELLILEASSESEIDAAFARLGPARAEAMFVPLSAFFLARARQIVALAAEHRVPTMFARRQFTEAGGLMSYDYDIREGYRQVGIYAGRILKGERPADLPVFQPTKFEFVINLKTAKALGLTIPETLLATADEVIQ